MPQPWLLWKDCSITWLVRIELGVVSPGVLRGRCLQKTAVRMIVWGEWETVEKAARRDGKPFETDGEGVEQADAAMEGGIRKRTKERRGSGFGQRQPRANSGIIAGRRQTHCSGFAKGRRNSIGDELERLVE
jgi:hypothetical protein